MAMPQRRLHDAQVSRSLPQSGREGMPQRVHSKRPFDSVGGEQRLEAILRLPRRESPATAPEEKAIADLLGQQG
jgi:hypothetical protein